MHSGVMVRSRGAYSVHRAGTEHGEMMTPTFTERDFYSHSHDDCSDVDRAAETELMKRKDDVRGRAVSGARRA